MPGARRTIESPVGPLTIEAAAGTITALGFGDTGRRHGGGALLDEAARQLGEYFAGARGAFDLPLAPEGTPFRQRVWRALRAIPYGETRSYGALARLLGSAPRAVGGACGANPIAIVIPCHRVVAACGALGGFSGGAGCDTKRRLFDHEAAGLRGGGASGLAGVRDREEERIMVKAVRMHEAGGPEVLRYDDVPLPDPGPGEAVVRHAAIGVNYIDVYHRTGLYPVPSLPWTIGMEGAGTVEAVGEGVAEVSVGDRVAYASPPPPGGYAEARVMPAASLVTLPGDVSFEHGAAMMLQGMTVEYLVRRTYAVKAGETVLVHAAAGGVGLIQCQWLKHLGATVVGTVGSEEKAALARSHGCDHPINYRTEDFAARVMEITDGAGVPVVYDSIGRDTIDGSLACLARLGTLASFGNASGPITGFDLARLAPRSAFITRPTLFGYNATRAELEASADALFEVVRSGAVRIEIHQTYPLAEAAQAHRDLEGRRTTGSTILIP